MAVINTFKDGKWNCICVVCDRKFKSSDMRKRWDGQMVCKYDLDPRHPQDFIRGVQDNNSIPFTYAEPEDTFVTLVCSTVSARAGVAIAGCAIAGNMQEDSSLPSGTNTGTL